VKVRTNKTPSKIRFTNNNSDDKSVASLGTRARRATPNKAQLRLYEEGVRRLKVRNQIQVDADKSDDASLNTRAKNATPNKAQLRLYSKKVSP